MRYSPDQYAAFETNMWRKKEKTAAAAAAAASE